MDRKSTQIALLEHEVEVDRLNIKRAYEKYVETRNEQYLELAGTIYNRFIKLKQAELLLRGKQ